ncbi:MAG: LLM class F420-dependent oxidoreductase [Gammaproteobacteria bacterium]|nr:LLM class F420-dependent oxidoreductase [Gammaproteobacteria bacterium]
MQAETLLPIGKLDPGLRAPDAALNLARVGNDAKLAEQLGYHSVLMEETKDDPFQVLALAATTTQRIRLGTSVAIAFARSPFVVAQSAWTLQKISGGRFELGLGSQVRGHIERRFGMTWRPPGPWMRDYVAALRALWQAWQNRTRLQFESKHYRLNLNVPLFTPEPIEHPDIPVLVAAVNPYMCRVAAEVADGIRLHPVCTRQYIHHEVLPALKDVNNNTFQICLKPIIAAAPNAETLEQRTEVARERLAFYCSTPSYAHAFGLFGLEDLCAEMATLSREQRWDEMSARIDDELLHKFVVVATYDHLATELIQRFGDCVDRLEVSIPQSDHADRETLAAIVTDLAAAPPRPGPKAQPSSD